MPSLARRRSVAVKKVTPSSNLRNARLSLDLVPMETDCISCLPFKIHVPDDGICSWDTIIQTMVDALNGSGLKPTGDVVYIRTPHGPVFLENKDGKFLCSSIQGEDKTLTVGTGTGTLRFEMKSIGGVEHVCGWRTTVVVWSRKVKAAQDQTLDS